VQKFFFAAFYMASGKQGNFMASAMIVVKDN